MKAKLFLLFMLAAMGCQMAFAQRFTDKLDRGLVAVPTGSSGNSSSNLVTWRRLADEYYDVTYNVYKNGQKVASNLTATSYSDASKAYTTTQYEVAAVVRGVEQQKCAAVKPWSQYVYKLNSVRCATGFIDIVLAPVYDRDGNVVTEHYSPNDAEMADLDGDGQLEIIIKRLNTVDASTQLTGKLYPESSREFAVIDAYDVDWQTGAASLMWRIDCGPNMVSMNATEIDVIAYDWDEDGKAEVVLRGADGMIVLGSDGTTQLYTIGDITLNTRGTFSTDDPQYAWTHTGAEYLIYMNGQTGAKYQVTDYPLKRLESNESDLKKAWGDNYGHRSSKYFFGAPFLDGRKASLFMARGIYTRHKMIAMDLDRGSHQWKTRWTWNCNDSNSPWYGNGYHNYNIADVDEDGRDEIVYGSMVIDDNGKGLSTTGYGHGDALHTGDFDPYRKGLEFFGCLEEKPYYGSNYRNATTSEVYFKYTGSSDDGRGLMANFSNDYPGCQGRSVGSGIISSVTDQAIEEYAGDSFIDWGNLNFRIYWDGDLCSEILDSPGTAKEACVIKPGTGRLFTSSGCNMNNDSKNNPCFQGDIIGDWREEIVVRCGTNLRVYTSGMGTGYSFPTLWNDHQYRQAMVWQMMAYNQPPHLSYFLGEMEGITMAPPTLTMDGRTEISNGGTVSTTTAHLLICEPNNMTVSVADGAAPYMLTVNTPTWVQGHDDNSNITTTSYVHTMTGGSLTGSMRLVKQGDGTLVMPSATHSYTGETNVWAGTLQLDGTLTKSAVWLNRFARLVSHNGTFKGGITMDYAAELLPGGENGRGAVTTTILTMNFGSRLVLDVYDDITSDLLNADKLVVNTKDWTAGPKYLKPVVQIVQHADGGQLPDGTYVIGNIKTVSGELGNLIVEGLEDMKYELKHENNQLLLIVGTGVSTTCPKAVVTETALSNINGLLLPTVSIDVPAFVMGDETVKPALSAAFTDLKGNTSTLDFSKTLYAENYEQATGTADWTTRYATLELADDEGKGKYMKIIQGGGSGPRSAYKRFYSTSMYDSDEYTVEFDAYFHYTQGNYDPNELCLYGEGAAMPNSNAIFSSPNYVFKLTGGKNYSSEYSVAGSGNTFVLENETWYHFQVTVDRSRRTVAYTISDMAGTHIDNGNYVVSDASVNMNIQGMEAGLGRAYSYAGIDNIRIYKADNSYSFTRPGTLTVTTSYKGCKSSSVVYEAKGIMPGDVNNDGTVNIVDVTSTISHVLGEAPENFVKEAADVNRDGKIDIVDVTSIIDIVLMAGNE